MDLFLGETIIVQKLLPLISQIAKKAKYCGTIGVTCECVRMCVCIRMCVCMIDSKGGHTYGSCGLRGVRTCIGGTGTLNVSPAELHVVGTLGGPVFAQITVNGKVIKLHDL